MATDAERREVARRLRELEVCEFDGEFIDCGEVENALGLVSDDGAWYEAEGVTRLADLIEPSCDLGPSGWTSFDERPPEPGVPVLCKGKNGAYYVGKPVTLDGERTGKVWVPRGAEYRSPAAWRPVDSPHRDRDVLLALADDIDKQTDGGMFDAWLEDGHYIARRIREACGEEVRND